MTHNIRNTIKKLLDQRTSHQIVLGIAGGSGAGKSTVAKYIVQQMLNYKIECLCLDQFFYPETEIPTYYSNYLKKEQPNFNRPDAMNFIKMVNHCREITGYDLVILEGHFALHQKEMRDLMDIKCFVDVEIQEILSRRTIRNLSINYGGDKETIENYNKECVEPTYKKYILPTKSYADILITNPTDVLPDENIVINLICEEIHCVKKCKH